MIGWCVSGASVWMHSWFCSIHDFVGVTAEFGQVSTTAATFKNGCELCAQRANIFCNLWLAPKSFSKAVPMGICMLRITASARRCLKQYICVCYLYQKTPGICRGFWYFWPPWISNIRKFTLFSHFILLWNGQPSFPNLNKLGYLSAMIYIQASCTFALGWAVASHLWQYFQSGWFGQCFVVYFNLWFQVCSAEFRRCVRLMLGWTQ